MDKPILKALSQYKERFKMSLGFARRNITRTKYRSFLLIFGVLLTVALETGLAISVDTLYDDFAFNNRNQNYTDITVNPSSWLELPDLIALAKDVRQIPGVATASPVIFFRVSRFLDQQFSTNILVYGIDSKTHPDIPHLDLIDGSRSISGSKILISEQIQTSLNLASGDTIDLSSAIPGLNILNVEIAGVISDSSGFGNKLGSLFIIADIETVLAAIPLTQRQTLLTIAIDASVKDFLRIKEVAEDIEDKIGVDFNVFVEKDVSDIKAAGIRAYQTAMNLVIIASFVVEFLFITNVLAISMRDRRKEIGILRSVGTNSRQLIELLGVEILIYAIIGSFIGVFVGIGFSTILVGIMDQFYTSVEFQAISLHPSSLIATFLSGIIVALISGLYPIFLAKTLPVIQNIHSRMRNPASSPKSSKTFWKYSIGAGFLLTFTAFFLQFFIGPSRFLDFSLISLHFLSILMIFLGTILIEVSILMFLPRIAMKVLVWFGIVTRTISTRNIAREFQKSLFTIMTSALALTFIIVVGSLSASIIAEVPNYFRNQWGTVDVVAEARDNDLIPINRTELLDIRSSIERSAFIQETRTDINSFPGYVFGVDPIQYSYFAEPVLRTYVEEPSYLLLNSTTSNTTNGLVSQHLYQRLGVLLGANVSIKLPGNTTVNITLVAVVKANMFLGSGEYLYINSSRYQEFFNSTLAKWFLCKKDEQSAVSSAAFAARSVLPEAKEITEIAFLTKAIERTLQFQTGIFEVLFIESFFLAAIAQFVCILVSTLHMEREMGIMRSFGLSKKGVFAIFMAESTALGFAALIIGLLDGFLGTILLVWYVSLSIPIQLYFPPERIAFWVIASFFITLASTIVPSYRSSQKNIVATIQGRPMRKNYVEKPQQLQYPVGSEITGGHLDYHHIQPSIYYQHSFQSVRQYIGRNKSKIWNIFLVLLLLATVNYLFDPHLLLRGLIPFDFFMPSFLIASNIFLNFSSIPSSYAYSITFLINPSLFFFGFASILPISSYLFHYRTETNFPKNILKSLLWGVLATFIVLFTWLGFFLINIAFLFIFITNIPGENFYAFEAIQVWLVIIYPFLLFGILTFTFQRMWAMLVYKGVNSDLSLKSAFTWARHSGGKGQLGFVALLFAHELLQIVLITLFRPATTFSFDQGPFAVAGVSLPLPPASFLILISFEIGFFILLILYQFAQIPREISMPLEVIPARNEEIDSSKFK